MKVKIGKYVTYVDKKYYLKFKDKHWSITCGWNNTPYVLVGGKSLSRAIMGTPKGLIAEHKNHNTLDNRRRNLRNATRAQNMWNRKKTCGSSKYKGVYFRPPYKKWRAAIYFNNKRISVGYFAKEEDAARAYNKRAKQLFGKFACLNIIGGKS